MRWWDGQRWTDQTMPVSPQGMELTRSHKRIEHAVIPTDRSALAIVAGYLGLFALVVVPAPLALLVGVLALLDLRRRPHLLGRGRAWFGVVTGAVGTVVFLSLLLRS
jgi:hypothetical protein